ncbi:MAG: L,D-transpeptidase, partial [Lachnospiraceae bacterium]|nr:L,D-transpeptidase [Lachnospiraceae bacterium]
WMRFSGNCGLHDASWRKAFGGDIYLHNGSHGCVNLPHDMAVALYDRVGIGTVVVVH